MYHIGEQWRILSNNIVVKVKKKMNNGYFLGEDGKYYDSAAAMQNANRVVENQQKQTEILERQAREQNRQNIENQRLAMQMAEATRQQNEQI